MSEQNVEVVRRVYAEWEQGKFGGAVALFDPDIVFESFMPDSSERVTFHGPEGVEVFMRESSRNGRTTGWSVRSSARSGRTRSSLLGTNPPSDDKAASRLKCRCSPSGRCGMARWSA